MTRFRTLLYARRWLALAVVLVALAVRIVVPAGMMPGFGAGGATLVVCSGHMTMPGGAMPGMAMPDRMMPGMAMPAKSGGKSDPVKSDAPCAFTGLIAAALDTPALPALPAMPLPVGILLVVVPIAIAIRTPRLRPPSRGPPGLLAA